MLIAILCAALVFLGFTAAMLCQERSHLIERAKTAEANHANAEARRYQAEQDALSAIAATVEAHDKIDRLSAHVVALLRQSAHDVPFTFRPMRFYQINRAAQIHAAAARRPEDN